MVMMLAGCSIKEDRTQCPCTVIVDFSGIDSTLHVNSGILALTDGTLVLDDEIPSARYGEPYTFRVRRVSTVIDIFSGWPDSVHDGTGLRSEGESSSPSFICRRKYLILMRRQCTLQPDCTSPTARSL